MKKYGQINDGSSPDVGPGVVDVNEPQSDAAPSVARDEWSGAEKAAAKKTKNDPIQVKKKK
jgi:hypothetical protein